MIWSYVKLKSSSLQNVGSYFLIGKALIKWMKSSDLKPIILSNWMECSYLDHGILKIYEYIINDILITHQKKYFFSSQDIITLLSFLDENVISIQISFED